MWLITDNIFATNGRFVNREYYWILQNIAEYYVFILGIRAR